MEKLGEILVQAGKITPEQLNVALRKQKQVAKRLGAVLIEEGFITDNELAKTLSLQFKVS
jgi:type IV pilus assembly protein PilB